MNVITVLMLHYRKWMYDKIIPDNLLEFRSEVDNCYFLVIFSELSLIELRLLHYFLLRTK